MAETYLVNPYGSAVDNSSVLGASLEACVGGDRPVPPCPDRPCPDSPFTTITVYVSVSNFPANVEYINISTEWNMRNFYPDSTEEQSMLALGQYLGIDIYCTEETVIPNFIFKETTYTQSGASYDGSRYHYDISDIFATDGEHVVVAFASEGYSITYHANDGTPEPENLTGQTNLPSPLPTIAKDDYTFDGWYLDSTFQTQAVAGAEISADTDLYAKFTAVYSVTYHANGGTPEPQNLTNQTSLPSSLPTISKENFSFSGWYYDDEFQNEAHAGDTLSSNVDLYAKFTRSHITLDLSTIGLPGGTHSIQMKLSDDGVTKADSELSNAVSYVVPEWETPVQDGDELTITQVKQITQIENILYLDVDFYNVTGSATHGAVLMGTGTFPEGTTVTIDGEPDDGYMFSSLIVNGETYSSLPFTFAVTEDTSFEIIFEAAPYVSHSAVNEVTSDTTLNCSISADIGDMVVCCFAVRSAVSSIASGWTLLGTSQSISSIESADTTNQTLSWAYKRATSTTETFTVTQESAGRIYINMVTLKNCGSVEMMDWVYNHSFAQNVIDITLNNQNRVPILYAATVSYWAGTSLWTNNRNLTMYQLGTQTQSRTVIAEDTSGKYDGVSLTNPSAQYVIIGGRLKLNREE